MFECSMYLFRYIFVIWMKIREYIFRVIYIYLYKFSDTYVSISIQVHLCCVICRCLIHVYMSHYVDMNLIYASTFYINMYKLLLIHIQLYSDCIISIYLWKYAFLYSFVYLQIYL